jgi:hypothetical protein
VITALIAGLAVLLIPSAPQSPARLLPVETSPSSGLSGQQPSPSPVPSLSIDTSPSPPIPDAPTWLPAGAELKARSTFSPLGSAVLSYQLAGAANAGQGTNGILQVWVKPDADGKAQLSSSNRTDGNGYLPRSVNGHPAVLTVPVNGVGGFSVQWVSAKRLLTVSMARHQTARGISGISVDDLLKVASSIR